MKKFKVVQVGSAETFESRLNELVASGYKVVTANLAYPAGTDPVYFALLESSPVDEELKQMLAENTDEVEASGLTPSDN